MPQDPYWIPHEDNFARARFGLEAIKTNPDHKDNSPHENLVDALTNLFHWAASASLHSDDIAEALLESQRHFDSERLQPPDPPVEYYIDAEVGDRDQT